jgi:hypothetical protein
VCGIGHLPYLDGWPESAARRADAAPDKGVSARTTLPALQVDRGRRMVMLLITPRPLGSRERTEAGGLWKEQNYPPRRSPKRSTSSIYRKQSRESRLTGPNRYAPGQHDASPYIAYGIPPGVPFPGKNSPLRTRARPDFSKPMILLILRAEHNSGGLRPACPSVPGVRGESRGECYCSLTGALSLVSTRCYQEGRASGACQRPGSSFLPPPQGGREKQGR